MKFSILILDKALYEREAVSVSVPGIEERLQALVAL